MAVVRVTRWSGGTQENVAAAIKKSREFATQFGAEIHASQVIGGEHAGQWLTWQRFPDMANYERAQAFYKSDPTVKETMTPLFQPFTIEERLVIATMDIS